MRRRWRIGNDASYARRHQLKHGLDLQGALLLLDDCFLIAARALGEGFRQRTRGA